MPRKTTSRPGPLDPPFLERRPDRPLRHLTLGARWAGRRDGGLHARALLGAAGRPSDGTAAAPTGVAPSDQLGADGPATTLWLTGNAHTYSERDRREFLAAEAAVAPRRVQLARLEAEVAAIGERLDDLTAERDRVGEEPSPQVLARRGAAETATPAASVAARRRRQHDTRYRAVATAVRALEEQRAGVHAQIAEVEAVLRAAFEAAVTRSARLREYHERRAAAYRRSHQRAWRRRTRRARRFVPEATWPLHAAETTLPAPAWTTQPCPWTPLRPVVVDSGRS